MRRTLLIATLVGLPFAVAELVGGLLGRSLLPFQLILLMMLYVIACFVGAAFYVPRAARRGGRINLLALKPYMPRFAYYLLLLLSFGTIALVMTALLRARTSGTVDVEAIVPLIFGGVWTSLLIAAAICLRYVREEPVDGRSPAGSP